MKKTQEVFQRYEKKYLLTRSQYEKLREAAGDRIVPDVFGRHTICNVYFDTESYELIRASIEKPPYKEKLRLRSYGTLQDDSQVFIELKKRSMTASFINGGFLSVFRRQRPIFMRG